MDKTHELLKLNYSNPERTCHYCGVTFILPGTNPKKYCSNSCRQRAYYVRNGLRKPAGLGKYLGNGINFGGFENRIKVALIDNVLPAQTHALQNATSQLTRLEAEVQELKRLLSYSNLKAHAYEEMIEVASEMLNVDIKKKLGAKQ